MVEKVFEITSEAGLHARPATALVQSVNVYQSDVNIEYKGRSVNLKSIMGVMSLGVPAGSEIKITAVGSDEQEAILAVISAIEKEALGVAK